MKRRRKPPWVTGKRRRRVPRETSHQRDLRRRLARNKAHLAEAQAAYRMWFYDFRELGFAFVEPERVVELPNGDVVFFWQCSGYVFRGVYGFGASASVKAFLRVPSMELPDVRVIDGWPYLRADTMGRLERALGVVRKYEQRAA